MHREREDIYDLDADVTLPELASVSPAVSGVAEEDTIHLTSIYYDTADLDLLRNGITVRRRSGTVDAGWQLKMPDGDSRIEIALPPSAGGVPKELRDIVLGARRGQPLQRLATVEISRDVRRHLAADGRLLAVVSDDTVHASSASKPAVVSDWREVQVELGEVGDEALLVAIGGRLIRAGAEPALIRSKLARALAKSLSAAGHAPSRDRSSVGSVATWYLHRQYAALIAGDVALRRGQDAFHAALTPVRRLRSTLRVFADLFEEHRAADLEAELTWLSGLLSEIDDLAVLAQRLTAAVAALPDDLVVGPVSARIHDQLAGRQERPRMRLMSALTGKRYLALLDELAQWASAPPVTDAAAEPAGSLSGLVERAGHAVGEQLRRVIRSDGDGDEVDRFREAAERARDAADLAAPQLGKKKAKARIRRYAELEEQIAQYQIALATAEFLRRLGCVPELQQGDPGFTYGLLFSVEELIARDARVRILQLRL